MKKNFKFYVLGWAGLLGLFNLLAFIIPAWPTLEKFTPSFWIGWGVTIGAFFGQLICAWIAFKEESIQKTFYNLSLFSISYAGLISMFVVAMICIIVTPLPYWIAAIGCAIVLVVNIIAILKAKAAVNIVASVDEKVKVQTFFIKSLTVDANTLMAMAKSDIAKAECKKVYEAIRYSDPMSNDALASVEGQITVKFAELSEAVKADNIDVVLEATKEILVFVKDRNNKCKLLK